MSNFNAKQILVFLGMGILALVLGFYFGQYRQQQEIAGGPSALQTIEAPDTSGNLRNTDEWLGKTLVINFWATWCPPCREEMPLFSAIQDEMGADNVQILGIAIDQPDPVSQYLTDYPVSYPSLVMEAEGMDVMSIYGNSGGLPFTLAVTPDGRIAKKHLGKVNREQILQLIDLASK